MSDDKLPAFYGEDQESLQVLLQDEFHATETLDFSRLLPDAVTQSGSFDFREVPEATVARLWDVLPLSILIVNRSGVITYVNRFCASLLGKSHEWIDGPFTAIFPERVDTDRIARLLETIYSDRRPVMVECSLEPDGRRIWTRIHLRSLRFRNERLALVFLEDLTAEKTGLLLTEKYKRLVQVFPIGIAEFGLASPVPIRGRLEGLLKSVAEASLIGGNHEFALMSGFAEIQEAKGVRLGKIFSFRGPSLNMFSAWIKGGCQIASLETKEFASPGAVTYFADTVVGNVEGGLLVGVWMMRNDITQRRLAEETLREKSDQLAQYSRSLEAQVKDRTRYLEQSQRRLEDYATKLEGANEALRMLIDGVEQQKKDREKKLRDSLKYSAKPLLDQLLTQPLSERSLSIVHSLIANLDTIAASLGTERVQNWELLTLREIRICEMIASGLTSKEIAEIMGVSPQTIFSHRTHIRRKLGLCGSEDDLASKLRNPNP